MQHKNLVETLYEQIVYQEIRSFAERFSSVTISVHQQTTRRTHPMTHDGKYECLACGYIYNPEVGDPDSGIAPGTPFEELPDDWVCPECGVGKDMFEELA